MPRLSPAVLAAFLLTHAGLKAVVFSSGFQLPADRLYAATAGLVTPVLLAGLVSWIVLVGGVALGLGRLRAADAGLRGSDLGRALAVLVPLWLGIQALSAASCALEGGVALGHRFGGYPVLHPVGLRLQAVLGSGLLEEVIYRGVLLPQAYLLARSQGLPATTALAGAALVTSLYFGVSHLPAGLRMGLPTADLAIYLLHAALAGLLFAALYVRSGNLFVAAGAHALINDPVALFAVPFEPALLALVAACALLLSWPWLSRRFGALCPYGALEGRAAF
ncbi:MAG: CPBP family intramembrane glutamic endopeptidase [Rubricoccaceae bacterium]|nr:CPBP family intramembrane glutamic endopeptidase [Rubricoccaceae bacterium]